MIRELRLKYEKMERKKRKELNEAYFDLAVAYARLDDARDDRIRYIQTMDKLTGVSGTSTCYVYKLIMTDAPLPM